MAIYTYKFVDETKNTIDVSDEWYAILIQMDKDEKNNNKREMRRHISLDYLKSRYVEFESESNNPLYTLIKQQTEQKLHESFAFLSKKQRELVKKVFFDDMTITAIAEQENVSQPAISQRLATIYGKLKKLL